MSLALAFSSALTGLHVTSRATQLVADNIANAQTEGYGVRTLDQSARVVIGAGGGVVARGVHRETDEGLLAERRAAAADTASAAAISDFWMQIERAVGVPDDPGSLAHQIGRLEDALSFAIAHPDSDPALSQIADAVRGIAQSFHQIQARVTEQRAAADSRIARDVDSLNHGLEEIVKLNREIQRQTLLGGAPQALMDTRQRLIDQVAEIVPVTTIAGDDHQIMLMAQDGTILAHRSAARFDFVRTPDLTPAELVEDGAVSALQVNGREIAGNSAMLSAGRLGAALSIRDGLAPKVQTQIDALAADTVTRFMGTHVDPGLPPGAFGLFALDGHSVMPADMTGIAGKLQLNALADPKTGGALWRLRDGLHAATPGPVAENAQFGRLVAALRDTVPLGLSAAGERSLQGHVVNMGADIGTNRLGAETTQSSSKARLAALQDALSAQGVDTDFEMSKLLVLERAYAANARVLATLDAMLRTVMEI